MIDARTTTTTAPRTSYQAAILAYTTVKAQGGTDRAAYNAAYTAASGSHADRTRRATDAAGLYEAKQTQPARLAAKVRTAQLLQTAARRRSS